MSDNIWDLVSQQINNTNKNIAWVKRVDKKISRNYRYQSVYSNVLQLSKQLRDSGVKKGDLIGVIAPNGPEWAVAAFAILRLGAIVAPIHVGNSVLEIDQQVEVVSPKYILTYKSPVTFSNEIPIIWRDESADELDLDDEAKQALAASKDDEAIRIYTSGSTGNAKMVRLSHANICANVRQAVAFAPPLGESDKFLSLLPLSHAMEFTAGLILPLSKGASIVLPRALAANEILAALQEEDITLLVAVPRLYRNIILGLERRFNEAGAGLKIYRNVLKRLPASLRKKFNAPIRKKLGPNMKAWVSGGSRLDPEISRSFHELGIPLRQAYGLTETSPVVCVQQEFDPVLESVGPPLEGVELLINEPNEKGIGEVWIKGPNVMLGYTDEQATAQAIQDDWFKSGDLGRIDKNGKLILTGRSKRLIVTEAGKNVYPEDLEVRLERLTGVKEAGVVEVEMRPAAILAMDTEEEVTAAVLVIDEENQVVAIEQAKRIIREYNSTASGHNQISRFALVNELPRTPLGKLAIKTLPEIFESNEVK